MRPNLSEPGSIPTRIGISGGDLVRISVYDSYVVQAVHAYQIFSFQPGLSCSCWHCADPDFSWAFLRIRGQAVHDSAHAKRSPRCLAYGLSGSKARPVRPFHARFRQRSQTDAYLGVVHWHRSETWRPDDTQNFYPKRLVEAVIAAGIR